MALVGTIKKVAKKFFDTLMGLWNKSFGVLFKLLSNKSPPKDSSDKANLTPGPHATPESGVCSWVY